MFCMVGQLMEEVDADLLMIYSEGVEQCIPWAENTTQQIDLAFNIFFMVYFFIRVSMDMS
jgi:hypothetical protein